MDYTEEQIEAMSNYALNVRNAAMVAVPAVAPPPELNLFTAIMASIDGLLAAIAMYAESGGIAPTPDDKERFADSIRSSVLLAMKEAREELEMGQTAH